MSGWYIDVLLPSGHPSFEGPFDSYEEAELCCAQHDWADYMIVFEEDEPS